MWGGSLLGGGLRGVCAWQSCFLRLGISATSKRLRGRRSPSAHALCLHPELGVCLLRPPSYISTEQFPVPVLCPRCGQRCLVPVKCTLGVGALGPQGREGPACAASGVAGRRASLEPGMFGTPSGVLGSVCWNEYMFSFFYDELI